jgi:NAD(P)H dehydrogenase (quinone)
VSEDGPVLVIGGAGKTGSAVCRVLLARGVSVRAAVHAGSPHRLGYAVDDAHRVEVDVTTGWGLDAAMDGASAVYHLAPNMHPDEVGIARRMLSAAAHAGVPRFVFHSVLHPHDRRMPHHLRKADAEEEVRGYPGRWTILQPASYYQNLLSAALEGRLAVPYSLDTPFTSVDVDDVARVAARVLTERGHHRATYELAGQEALTVRDLAVVAREVLGQDVEAVQIPFWEWSSTSTGDVPDQVRHDLEAMFTAYDGSGLCGNATVLTHLLGRPPTTWGTLLSGLA